MRIKSLINAFLFAALTGAFVSPVSAHDLHLCDYLAVNPLDPDRILPGIPRADMDVPRAISVCQEASSEFPDEPRFKYQLGRAMFYAGDRSGAVEEWGKAAAQGYRQADFMIGLVIDRKYPDLPQAPCEVEDRWAKAARLGHSNAQISYVHGWARGTFEGCRIQVTKSEMSEFLDAAAPHAGYLGRILISDLRADLGTTKGENE